MKIAVISDLHVGSAARAKDYCPPHDAESRALDENYQKMFLDFIKREQITANFLLMPGDLSNRSKFTEVELASKLMFEIADALKVDREKILSVPGNHDVDWSIFQPYAGPERIARREKRYDSLMSKDSIFSKQTNTSSLLSSPYYSVWDFDEVLVVGANSSWDDEPNAAVHHGIVMNECIDQIEHSLSSIKDFEKKIKIFLIHHHPVNYSDPIYNTDFSQMQNAERLLQMLMRKSFDFLIHGHKHVPKFKIIRENSSFPLNILCAGSFSVLLDTRLSGHVNNQFHLIDIHSRDHETLNANGLVLSWTFLSQKGWTPSHINNGIDHVMPFGSDIHPNVLEKYLKEDVLATFKDKSHYKVYDTLKKHEKYRYLPADMIKTTLSKLKLEVNFEIHETHKDIILLKNE